MPAISARSATADQSPERGTGSYRRAARCCGRTWGKSIRASHFLSLLTFARFTLICPASVEPSLCMRMLSCELFTRIAYICPCVSYAHCVYMTYEQRAVAQQETDR